MVIGHSGQGGPLISLFISIIQGCECICSEAAGQGGCMAGRSEQWEGDRDAGVQSFEWSLKWNAAERDEDEQEEEKRFSNLNVQYDFILLDISKD